jgi:hypothetical protein
MSTTRSTISPVTPDPMPRDVDRAVAFCLARAKESDEIAARIRAEGGDPSWHVDRADSERRQAYVLRLEAITGQRCCTRCLLPGHTRLGERECRAPMAQFPDPVPREPERRPPNVAPLLAHMDSLAPTPEDQAVHAAERAFLAAYRAHRDEMSRFLKMTSFDERWTVQCDATEASRVAHNEARTALDAADAAARDGEK